jgi:hypothetical protein
VDLFEPGSGSQVHDFNGGVLASGLFWTLPLGPRDHFHVSADGTRARLRVHQMPVIDSFSFGSPGGTPATVGLALEWRATARAVARGRGNAVGANDPAAFRGQIAPALATGWCHGVEFGFRGVSDPGASSARGYALLGHERNGSAL